MSHRCVYRSRFIILNDYGEKNELAIKVRASTDTPFNKKPIKSEDVYIECLNGHCYGRYLQYAYMGGYLVTFPGEKYSRCYGGDTVEEQDFEEYYKMNLWCSFEDNPNWEIVENYTNKYFTKKLRDSEVNPMDTLEIIRMFQKHKECEYLLPNQPYIAMKESIYKLKSDKKRKVSEYIRNQNPRIYNYSAMMKCFELGIPYQDMSKYGSLGIDKIKFIRKRPEIDPYEYQDYYKMLKHFNREKDEYWVYPKNFHKMHYKIIDEIENERRYKEEIERAEYEKSKIKEEKMQKSNYSKAVKKLTGKIEEGEWVVYVPQTIEEISKQATLLHQCLITCDYVSEVINFNSILVFISKNGEPSSTFQVSRETKKIIQFYGNERDRYNCQPTDYERVLADKFMKSFGMA